MLERIQARWPHICIILQHSSRINNKRHGDTQGRNKNHQCLAYADNVLSMAAGKMVGTCQKNVHGTK